VKALLLVYDMDFEEEVMEVLREVGLSSFTLWERVLGQGERSEPKLGTHAWPSLNRALLLVMEEGQWKKAAEKVRELTGRPGIRAFLWEVEGVGG